MKHVWLLMILLLSACDGGPRGDAPLTVFAAASMTDVVTRIARQYEADTGASVQCSFAATSTLARQIEAGAPADVFIPAHPKWINHIAADRVIDLARNQLVVIIPRDAEPGDDLEALLRRGRIAMGDPAHVPAGEYAKQSLQSLGVWALAEPYVLAASDVRAALRYVEVGEAKVGIVYVTDARRSERVRVALALPGDSHDPIVYRAAALRDAHGFLDYLTSPPARQALTEAGFTTTE